MRNVVGLPLLALALSTACATTVLTDRERDQVSDRWTNQSRELAHSMWVARFFVDDSRRLLSLEPPDEEELLDDTEGKPIWPGPALDVLPAGTKVAVTHVTFPGSWSNLTRHIETPRDRIWVELAVAGNATPIYVLVLRPDVKSPDDVAAEIDKLLTEKPLDSEVKTLSAADQKIVATKELTPGPTTRGLELAFETPILKKISSDGTTRLEDWTWKSDTAQRQAHLKDGVVLTVEGPAVKHETAH